MANIVVNPSSYVVSNNSVTITYNTDVTPTKVELSVDNSTYINSTTFSSTQAIFNLEHVDDGTYSSCKIKVTYEDIQTTINVTSVSISPPNRTCNVGDSFNLVATISPSNATNKTVVWGNSNNTISSITQSGLFTATKSGNTTVSVATQDGGKTATCQITINNIEEQFKYITSNTGQLTIDTKPIEQFRYITSNTGQLVINTDTTILVQGITLNKLNHIFNSINDNIKLIATISPSNATNKKINWTSANGRVAIVDSDGNVTSKGSGITNIIATTESNGKVAVCSITVDLDDGNKAIAINNYKNKTKKLRQNMHKTNMKIIENKIINKINNSNFKINID